MHNGSLSDMSPTGAAAKQLLYRQDCMRGVMACDAKGDEYPLGTIDIDNVRYVAGVWRIQNKFDHPIQVVRDRQFVLLSKLNRTERNHFEYYRASMVGQNCYGYFLTPGLEYIVAKYETNRATYWAYGNSIEQARAFLGIRLYEEYMDVIHTAANAPRAQNGK